MVKIGLVIGLLVISTVVSANAQATKHYRADIKFDFSIGAKTYESGKYDIWVVDKTIVLIEDMKGSRRWIATGSPNAADLKREDTVLVFHQYNDRYFLNKVVSNEFGAEMKKSSGEQALIVGRDMQMKAVSLKLK